MKVVLSAEWASARTLRKVAGILLLFSVSLPGYTNEDQPQPPWLQPDVLRAALALNMSEEQLPNFKQALTGLVQGHQKALNRVLTRNNVSNMKQKLKSASNRQFAKFDKAMFKFLNETQHEQYAVYRKLLKTRMKESAGSQGGMSSRESGQINSALDGYTDSN